ncbi:MAG: hypothetical protein ACKO3F_07090 [Cyanobium sp.]
MILVDTNLWLYAAMQDIPQHSAAQAWLEATFNHQESIALPWSVAYAGHSSHLDFPCCAWPRVINLRPSR